MRVVQGLLVSHVTEMQFSAEQEIRHGLESEWSEANNNSNTYIDAPVRWESGREEIRIIRSYKSWTVGYTHSCFYKHSWVLGIYIVPLVWQLSPGDHFLMQFSIANISFSFRIHWPRKPITSQSPTIFVCATTDAGCCVLSVGGRAAEEEERRMHWLACVALWIPFSTKNISLTEIFATCAHGCCFCYKTFNLYDVLCPLGINLLLLLLSWLRGVRHVLLLHLLAARLLIHSLLIHYTTIHSCLTTTEWVSWRMRRSPIFAQHSFYMR